MSVSEHWQVLWAASLVAAVLLCLTHPCHAQLTVEAVFNQRGVRGSIVFSQDTLQGNTTIAVNLTGLETFQDMAPFPWHVHEYPFPLDAQQDPCRGAITGGHYNPLNANTGAEYAQNCATDPSLCEVGDLSGRHDPLQMTGRAQLVDSVLSLYGIYSIIGRSIVLHFSNNSRLVCANIGYPQQPGVGGGGALLYVPFRSVFSGNIYFRQHASTSTSSVYTDLVYTNNGSANSVGHNWHVHESPVDVTGTDCVMAGPHYNPRGVDVSLLSYATYCNPSNQTACEIGDLSNKGSPFAVRDGAVKQFYTDTDLPLSEQVSGEGFSIAERSVVIHAADGAGPRIDCANILRYTPLEAEAVFVAGDGSSISGRIRFSQISPFDRTRVDVQLSGLGGVAGGYHVHVGPIGPRELGFPARCGGTYAGGHWNPLGVVYNNSNPPVTSDDYEVGDLSGKFGSLSGADDIDQTFLDPNIPLYGPLGIIGRSVVVHRDSDGSRWACADIVHARLVIRVSYSVNSSSLTGQVTFLQLADDPFADTTIVVELEVIGGFEPPVQVSSMQPLEATPSMSMAPLGLTSMLVVSTPAPSSSQVPAMSPSPSPSPSPTQAPPMSPSPVLPTPISSQAPPLSSQAPPSSSPGLLMPLPSSSVEPDFFMTNTQVVPLPSATPTAMTRKRRSAESALRMRRQVEDSPVAFEWSLRMGMVTDPAMCDSLPLSGGLSSNADLCSTNSPMLCSAGDLISKHGPLNVPRNPGLFRAVFTDANLPLSGPLSPFSSGGESMVAFLVQPRPGATASEVTVCNSAAEIVVPPPTTMPPPTTPPTTMSEATPQTTLPTTPPTTPDMTTTEVAASPLPNSNVGGIVGGVIAAIVCVVLVVLIVLLVVWLFKRRNHSKYDLNKASELEMGVKKPSKPVLGVPNYKVLHHYETQNEDDLALQPGEWVTLEETPYGGGWWKGTIEGKGTGWFPKTYVDYVDREAEKRRRKDETFTLAAAAIMGASSSFSANNPSVSTRRDSKVTPQKGSTAKRTHTFSKKEIDSTPRMLSKFDKPYLERDNVVVIENMMKEGSQSGGSRPDTPGSVRNNEIIANIQATESGASSQDDQDLDLIKAHFEEVAGGGEVLDDLLPYVEKHAAKYDFAGTTDIELEFKKGNVIKVIEKSDNGWWKGVYMGNAGWFPESYVDLTPLPNTQKGAEVSADEVRGRAESASSAADVERPRNMDEMMADAGGDLEALEYHALYSYGSETEGDLAFSEGDTVLVYWGQDNGWWYGAAGGQQGWFPESYVQPIIDTSHTEAAAASEANTGTEPSHQANLTETSAKQSAERAPSSESQDSGVGHEEVKEDLAKGDVTKSDDTEERGLQGELAKALQKRKSLPASTHLTTAVEADSSSSKPSEGKTTDAEGKTTDAEEKTADGGGKAGGDDAVFDAAVPSTKTAPPVTDKTKALKVRRQSAPAKSPGKSRRIAPPPPAATPGSSPMVTPKLSPRPPGTPTLAQAASRSEDSKVPAAESKEVSPAAKTPVSAMVQSSGKKRVPKRRTTAIDNRTKPHRRAPPPVPPALLAANAATNAATPTSKPAESAETKTANLKKDARSETPVGTPIPPPRAKARMKKVKRPVSRMIPPPPRIPLPPPPPSKNTVSPLTSTMKADDTITPAKSAATNPAYLETKPGVTPRGRPKGSRPPPPTRISSLLPESKLPPLQDEKEGVSSENRPPRRQPSSKTTPPKRPPPPRPTSTISSLSTTSKPSRPPSAPKQDPEAGTIQPRGSKLMSSLKKMVKRDSKGASASSDDKPKRPSQPPKRSSSSKQPATEPLLSNEDSSPVPKPRTKKKSSVSSPPSEDLRAAAEETSASAVSANKTESNPPPRPSNPPRTPSTKEDTKQDLPAQERRKSSNIPAKPPPPAGSKPKPPLAPKPSLSPTPGQTKTEGVPSPTHTSKPVSNGHNHSEDAPSNFYRAVKAYKAKSDAELSYSVGDSLIFIEKREGGFYYGMLDSGSTGLFPVDSVEPYLK